ncbi:hypothetical protein GCM10023210_40250 [Chryseobacterium ginsengisoli]|uniref:DUF304 domain-containing protein n=1 Tax=Chryseobacterium ginsengisoli TaxID=363853 RepID=A0ABP9MSW0_9FLAO
MLDEYNSLLIKDETIIKLLSPKIAILFNVVEFIKIIFSIFWCGIAYMILKGHLDNFQFFDYILFPFFTISGFYILIGRYLKKGLKLYSTKYIITNKRIIIKSSFILFKDVIINIGDIKEIYVEFNTRMFGNIILEKPQSLFGGRGMNYGENKYSLESIQNVFDIVQIINVNHVKVYENEY